MSPVTQSTGLLSSQVSSVVSGDITTLYTKKVFGTYIGNLYAHYAQTESQIISPSITSTATNSFHLTPASIIYSTDINSVNSETTVFTTEIYMTHINDFPAQFTRSTFNIIDNTMIPSMSSSSLSPLSPSSSKNYPLHLHFPSPLRSRHKQPQTVSPTLSIAVVTSTEIVTTTVTATASIDAENKSKDLPSTYNLHTLIKSSNLNTSTSPFLVDSYSIDQGIATSSRTHITTGAVDNNNDDENAATLDYPSDTNEAEYEENESSFEEEKALPGLISRHRSSREENSPATFINDDESGVYDNYDSKSTFINTNSQSTRHQRDHYNSPGGLVTTSGVVNNQPTVPAVFGQRVSANMRSSSSMSSQSALDSPVLVNTRSRQMQPHVRHPPVDPVSPVTGSVTLKSTSHRNTGSRSGRGNFATSSSSRFQSGPAVILTKEEPEDSTFEFRTSTSQRQSPSISASNGGRRSRIDVPSGDSPVNGASRAPTVSGAAVSVAFASSSSSTSSSSQKYNRINGQNGNLRRGSYSRTGRNGNNNNRSRSQSTLIHDDHDEGDSIVSGGIYPSNSNGNNYNLNGAPVNSKRQTNMNTGSNNNGMNGRRRGQSTGRTIKTIILAPSVDLLETHLIKQQLSTTPTPYSSIVTWSAPPKSTLTVTSIATWVKTLPIRHGFKTSYATITTQGFNTSIIKPHEYEIIRNPTDTSKFITQITSDATSIDSAGVQRSLIVTTTDLSEIKLIPIRVGYSTRTDTSTTSYILTTLKTIFSTPPLPPAYTLITATVSTTATITSTSVSSLVLGGKTLLSTLTSTSLQETTIVTTRTVPLGFFATTKGPSFNVIESGIIGTSDPVNTISPSTVVTPISPTRSLFTTLITFQITDDQGDITKLVTPVTLPVDAIVHKVASREAKLETIDTVTRKRQTINATPVSSFLSSPSSSSLDHTLKHSDLIPSPPDDPKCTFFSSSLPSHNPHDARSRDATFSSSSSSPAKCMLTNAKIITTAAAAAAADADASQLQSNASPASASTSTSSVSHVPLLSASFSSSLSYYSPSSQSMPVISFNEKIMSNTRSSLHFSKGFTSQVHSTGNNKSTSGLIKSPVKHKKASSTVKEDKYVVHNFKQRRLQQFNLANDNSDDFTFGPSAQSPGSETFFRDFGRVVPLPPSSQFSSSPSASDGISSGLNAGQQSPLVPPGHFDSPPPPSTGNFGGRAPTFQRLKVTPGNNPFARLPVQSAPPPPQAPVLTNNNGQQGNQLTFTNGFAPSGDNSPFTRFHRIVSNKPEIPLRTTTNFRRVPVFGNQLPPSIPSPFNSSPVSSQPLVNTITLSPPVPTLPPSPSVQPQSIPIAINNEFNNQPSSNKPFRRVRPNQGSNQISNNNSQPRRNRPNRVQTDPSITNEPATTTNSPVTTFKSLLIDNEPVTEVTTITPVTNDARRLVRIRRPPNSSPGSRRRVIVRPQSSSNSIRIPANNEPINNSDDEKLNNSLDVDSDLVGSVFGSRVLVKDETPSSGNFVPSQVVSARVTKASSSPLPLTYLTTYTYLTTVLRGPHTLVTSRLSTESSIATEILDDSEIASLSDARILPTKTVNIGSRTKGPTTTIVNVQSEVRATYVQTSQNNQIIQPSVTVPVSSVIRPTVSIHRKPVIEAPVTSEVNSPSVQQTIAIDQLNKVPKAYFTKYTYFYTVVDGSTTRKSTRSEVVSSRVDSPVNLNELNIKPTITNGLLSIGSGAETVHLGRRSFGKSTTEVNLAMETYLQLEGITNAVIESVPTLLPNLPHEATSSLPDSSVVLSSLSQDESTTIQPTPDIPSRGSLGRVSSRIRASPGAGSIRSSGVINVSPIRSDILRSRVVVSSRPLRVRVRQSSRIVSPVVSSDAFDSIVSSSPVLIEPSSSISPESSSDVTLSDLISPTPVVDLEVTSSTVDVTDETSKRRLAVTVRRPFGGLNRLRTRTRGQVTSSLDNTLITPSEIIKESTAPSSRVALNRLRVASRVFKPHLHSISLNPNEHPEPPIEITSSSAPEDVTSSTSLPVLPSGSLSGSTDALDSTEIAPSTVVITYFTTTTHTVPFTVGDKTLYTTFEMTNTRIATETIDPSTGLRTNTPSIGSSESIVPISPSISDQPLETKTMFTTFTFFTTFFTGDTSTVKSSEKVISNVIAVPVTSSPVVINPSASVEIQSSSSSLPEYTSSPVFTGSEWSSTPSVIAASSLESSSEPSLSPSSPSSSSPSSSSTSSSSSGEDAAVIVTETTEKIDVSTIYSTQTFYATLYNGNTSTITPIEETKTELLTLREPVKVTRTIWPDGHVSSSLVSSTFSKTYFTTHTSLVTLVSDNQIITKPIEQVTSSVITFTIAPTATKSLKYSSSTVIPQLDQSAPKFTVDPSLLTTRATHTTLTHYITLYSGTNTVLSSVTEISPTIVTEAVSFTPYNENNHHDNGHVINKLQGSKSHETSNNNLLTSFSPSISTLLTTHTYFTTLFSGTTSFVSSRADVSSSLVTLYVPAASVTPSPAVSSITPTQIISTGIELNPSLISSSSDISSDTSVNEKVLDDLRSQILSMASSSPSVTADVGTIVPSSIDTSSSDQTILFTDHIMPSSSSPSSENTSEVTSDGSNDSTVKVSTSSQPDSVTESSDSTIKSTSGSVVDLEDILSGSGKINGNLGAAIKDIVSLFASKETNGKQQPALVASNSNNPDVENTGSSKTPQPVYVPAQNERTTESIITLPNEPDLEPVFKPESSISEITDSSSSSSSVASNTQSVSMKGKSAMMIPSAIATPSLPATRLMDSTSRAVFSQVGAGATTIFFGDADANVSPTLHISGSLQPTRYVTSVESLTRTLTLTTTKVYYTRDSPLTITSVLTTVIPPKTFVSTIIGSRTILGTAGEASRTQVTAIQPTETLPEATTTITTTTLIFNSITTTVVRTLVIPNEIQATKPSERTFVTRTPSSAKPTRKPLISVRTTSKTTPPPVPIRGSSENANKKRKPLPKPSLPSIELENPINRGSSKPINKITVNTSTPVKPVKVSRVPIVEDDQCSPGCNTANKEICIEDNGKYKCDCRPGYSRKDSSSQCKGK